MAIKRKFKLHFYYYFTLIKTDSYSALLAIRDGFSRSLLVNEIQSTLLELQTKSLIVRILWTKVHVGTVGNERADELAKEATERQEIDIFIDIPLSYIASVQVT